MKILIQRVKHASVKVEEENIGKIDQGILAFVGIEKDDDNALVEKLIKKLLNYRIFSDAEGKMNLSLSDIKGGVLLVSQFTLAANTQKGLRPSFSSAAPPADAESLFNYCVEFTKANHHSVATGKFGADMQVSLLNDGPVTFLLG